MLGSEPGVTDADSYGSMARLELLNTRPRLVVVDLSRGAAEFRALCRDPEVERALSGYVDIGGLPGSRVLLRAPGPRLTARLSPVVRPSPGPDR
jgi:hypothetical protein